MSQHELIFIRRLLALPLGHTTNSTGFRFDVMRDIKCISLMYFPNHDRLTNVFPKLSIIDNFIKACKLVPNASFNNIISIRTCTSEQLNFPVTIQVYTVHLDNQIRTAYYSNKWNQTSKYTLIT